MKTNTPDTHQPTPMDEQCEGGCKRFYGGEVRHDPNCVFYPESFTQMYDNQKATLTRYEEALKHYADKERWTSQSGSRDESWVHDKYWGNHGSDHGYTIAAAALQQPVKEAK